MGPKQAWEAFSVILILGDLAASVLLYDLGIDLLLVVAFALIILLIYVYILYKRYQVEVITETDVMLFDDPDDLRILCAIYGLDSSGEVGAMRQSLLKFVHANKDNAFTWVAPRAVISFGSAFEMPKPMKWTKPSGPGNAGQLIGGKPRSSARLSSIVRCPVCDAKAPRKSTICPECGADLEFYAVLSESRVGKLMLSEKSGHVRRKLRYEVPPLREDT